MQNAINWFEIPSVDFDRAVNFYENILDIKLNKGEFLGDPQAYFPSMQTGVGGSIVRSDRLAPSTTGTLIYLNAVTGENLEQALERVESNSGKVLMPKTAIGEFGMIGIILDTEGNSIGLHAPK